MNQQADDITRRCSSSSYVTPALACETVSRLAEAEKVGKCLPCRCGVVRRCRWINARRSVSVLIELAEEETFLVLLSFWPLLHWCWTGATEQLLPRCLGRWVHLQVFQVNGGERGPTGLSRLDHPGVRTPRLTAQNRRWERGTPSSTVI